MVHCDVTVRPPTLFFFAAVQQSAAVTVDVRCYSRDKAPHHLTARRYS